VRHVHLSVAAVFPVVSSTTSNSQSQLVSCLFEFNLRATTQLVEQPEATTIPLSSVMSSHVSSQTSSCLLEPACFFISLLTVTGVSVRHVHLSVAAVFPVVSSTTSNSQSQLVSCLFEFKLRAMTQVLEQLEATTIPLSSSTVSHVSSQSASCFLETACFFDTTSQSHVSVATYDACPGLIMSAVSSQLQFFSTSCRSNSVLNLRSSNSSLRHVMVKTTASVISSYS